MPARSHSAALGPGTSSNNSAGLHRSRPARRQNQQLAQFSGSGPSSSSTPSSRQRRSPASEGHRSSRRDHHPFRIEVQEVTPVSISLRWSLRPPPISDLDVALSAASQPQRPEKTRHSVGERNDDDDDDATAVDGEGFERDEEFTGNTADSRQTPSHTSALKSASTLSRIFDSGVSVVVNGITWSQVVMANQGADESVIVVYGLMPDHEYEVEMTVGSDASEKTTVAATCFASPSHTGPSGEAAAPSSAEAVSPAIEGGFTSGIARVQTSTSAHDTVPTVSLPNSESGQEVSQDVNSPPQSSQASELAAAEHLRNSLATELRQARKESSRAEQALRNEIEAIKRSLDRMSSIDHRSKQKVLALQELIRQANQSAKDIAKEAEIVEGEYKQLQREADDLAEQEQAAEKSFSEVEASSNAQVKEEEEATAAAEKELIGLQKALSNKQGEIDKLVTGKVAELEEQITKLQKEAHRIEHSPTPLVPPHQPAAGWQRWSPEQAGFMGPSATAGSGFRSVSGPAAAPRGHRGERGGQGGRGGPRGGHRNASGLHSHSNFHRRARGGGSANSATLHNNQHVAFNHSGSAGISASIGPSLPPHGGNIAAAVDSTAYGAHSVPPYAAQENLLHIGSGGYQGLRSLNPTSSDFVPSSVHTSPVIGKQMGPSPVTPAMPTAPNPAKWRSPVAAPGQSDFNPAIGPSSGMRHARSSPKTGLGSDPNAAAYGSNDSSTMPHGSHFALNSAHAAHRDSPTVVLATSTAFGSSTGMPAFVMPKVISSLQDSRRSSFGPLDYTDDSAFDPTAPAPPPIYDSSHVSGLGPLPLISSPWARNIESVSPSLTSGPSSNVISSPWSSTSPLGGAPRQAVGMSSSSDDIWSTGPPLASASAKALLNHPSLLIGSTSVFGHPHRSGSGSSSPTNSGGGHASTPTSPTAVQRAGSFGAIGGGKVDSSASASNLGPDAGRSPIRSPKQSSVAPAR